MKKSILLVAFISFSILCVSAQEWIQTNGPYGADVMALTTGPDAKIYAGTKGGGVFGHPTMAKPGQA